MGSLAADIKNKEESEEDPVELMLKKTGCIDLHYQLQVKIIIIIFFLTAAYFYRS